MSEEYYKLLTLRKVDGGSKFEISRATDILTAAMRHRDYSVVELLKHDDYPLECIVVDVEADGVPPHNRHGIRYKERLALCVPGNPKQLVEVLALRKDFPVLMHQNNGSPDSPRSLCLYFEPPASVSRNWTPQRFLRRIQWWLERSATGELHPADQPVEQLFFATKNELILPWNFEELRKSKEHHLVIVHGPERSDGGGTCFIEALPMTSQPPRGTVQPFEFTLSPIVQGRIHCDPTTLGKLANLLSDRGVELLPILQERSRNTVGEMGVPESTDDKFSIIILHIPVTRTRALKSKG